MMKDINVKDNILRFQLSQPLSPLLEEWWEKLTDWPADVVSGSLTPVSMLELGTASRCLVISRWSCSLLASLTRRSSPLFLLSSRHLWILEWLYGKVRQHWPSKSSTSTSSSSSMIWISSFLSSRVVIEGDGFTEGGECFQDWESFDEEVSWDPGRFKPGNIIWEDCGEFLS